jgi:hypothetical protein
MGTFIAVVQAYERESGRGFRVRFRLRAPDAATARAVALEEAVREGLSVAVLETLLDVGEDGGGGSVVLSISAREYLEEGACRRQPNHAPRARNSD